MPSKLVHVRTVRLQHLRDEQAQLAVAENRHFSALRGIFTWSRISQAAASGSVKTACSMGRLCRERVQIRFGQGQEFAKCAGMLHDAEHGAAGAMTAEPAARTTRSGRRRG